MATFTLDPSYDGVFFADSQWQDLVENYDQYRDHDLLPRHLKAPLLTLWEITGRCNLRCLYCYNESPRTPPDLEWPLMERLVRELVDMKVFMVCVSGGEPTLHPHYLDILRSLSEGGVLLGTVTNGWTMTPELARGIARYVKSVQISIDGPRAEVHDAIRGRSGSFERAVKAIGMLKEAGVPGVAVAFAATRVNVDCFPEMADFCAGLGVTSLRTQPLAVVGRASQQNIETTPEQVQRLEEFIAGAKGRYGDMELEWGDPYVHVAVGLKVGMAMGLRITQDGFYGFTPYYPVFLGNAREHSILEAWAGGLREAWSHPRVRSIFESLDPSPILRNHPDLSSPLHISPCSPAPR